MGSSSGKSTNQEAKRAIFCRKCGKKLAVDAIFCPQCGTKIVFPAESPAQANSHVISSSPPEQKPTVLPKPEKSSEPSNPVDVIKTYEDFLKHYAKKG